MEIHHIGYIVSKMPKALSVFEKLGYRISVQPTWDEIRKADICFLKNGEYCIELIAPSRESKLCSFLQKYDGMPYHICYYALNGDMHETILYLKEMGFMPITEIEDAPVISPDAKVVFLINPYGGLVELLNDTIKL